LAQVCVCEFTLCVTPSRSMKVFLFLLGACLSLTQSESPITRVVTLLNELKGQINADESEEQAVYNKYACWCETTTHRKSQAIHQARDDITADSAKVLELHAKINRLASEIQKANEDIAKSEKDVAGLTKIRNKEHENYLKIRAESEQAIQALDNAVNVLSGAGGKSALLQTPALMSVYSALNQVISVNSVSKKDLALAQELLRKFNKPKGGGVSTYAPQSATILGILTTMHENFVADLKELKKDEKTQSENFLMASMKQQDTIKLLREQTAKLQMSRAEAQTFLRDTEQRLLDTTEQLADDVTFFDTTKAACEEKARAWEKRQELRTQELNGISEALKILTSEQDVFDRAIKPGLETFVQFDASRVPRDKAFKMIATVAAKSKSLRLAALAASIKTRRFTEVLTQIDKILVTMKAEEQTDVERRDNCITERHELNEENARDKHNVKVFEGKVAKKERMIEKNNVSLAEIAETVRVTEKELAELSEQRLKENQDFIAAKEDDETAIGVLDEVLAKLSAFHGNDALMQEPTFEVSQDQAPEAKFSDKDNRKKESHGIIHILQMIQEDLKNEIAFGIKDEAAAQAAFEKQKDAIEKLLDALSKKTISLDESNAARSGEIDEEETNIINKELEIEATNEELAGLKEGCDWLMENFHKRADKRSDEIAALNNARGILAGADKVSLINKHKFDDEQLPSLEFTSLSFLQRN